MLFVNSAGQPIIRPGQLFPRDCEECPCVECDCETDCYNSVLHLVSAVFPGLINVTSTNVYHCKCTYAGQTFDLYLDATSKPLSYFSNGKTWFERDDKNADYDPFARLTYDTYVRDNPDDTEGQAVAYETYLAAKDEYNQYYTLAELAGQTGNWRSKTPLAVESVFDNRMHALGLIAGTRPQYYVRATMTLHCSNIPVEPFVDATGIKLDPEKDAEGWILKTTDCDFGPPRKAKLTMAYLNVFEFKATVQSWNSTTERYEDADTFVHTQQNITDLPVALYGVENVTVLGGMAFPLSCIGVSANNVPAWMGDDWHWSDHVNPAQSISAPDFFQIYNLATLNSVERYSYFRYAADYAFNTNEQTLALTDFDNSTSGVCYLGRTTCNDSRCEKDLLFQDVSAPAEPAQIDPEINADGNISQIDNTIDGSTSTGSTMSGTTSTVVNGDGSTSTNTNIVIVPPTGNPTKIDVTTNPDGSSTGTVTNGDGSTSTYTGTVTTDENGGSTSTGTVTNGDGSTSTIVIVITPNTDGDGGSTFDGTIHPDGGGDDTTFDGTITPVFPVPDNVPTNDYYALLVFVSRTYNESTGEVDYCTAGTEIIPYHVVNGSIAYASRTIAISKTGDKVGSVKSCVSSQCLSIDVFRLGFRYASITDFGAYFFNPCNVSSPYPSLFPLSSEAQSCIDSYWQNEAQEFVPTLNLSYTIFGYDTIQIMNSQQMTTIIDGYTNYCDGTCNAYDDYGCTDCTGTMIQYPMTHEEKVCDAHMVADGWSGNNPVYFCWSVCDWSNNQQHAECECQNLYSTGSESQLEPANAEIRARSSDLSKFSGSPTTFSGQCTGFNYSSLYQPSECWASWSDPTIYRRFMYYAKWHLTKPSTAPENAVGMKVHVYTLKQEGSYNSCPYRSYALVDAETEVSNCETTVMWNAEQELPMANNIADVYLFIPGWCTNNSSYDYPQYGPNSQAGDPNMHGCLNPAKVTFAIKAIEYIF